MEKDMESFDLNEHLDNVGNFLTKAGYTLRDPEYVGFVLPHVWAEKVVGEKKYTIFSVIKASLDEALDGFRDLTSMKHKMGKDCDYLLILPTVSEYLMIEFLTTGRAWYYDIKREAFLVWISEVNKHSMTSILGWPLDDGFKEWFSNPGVAGFDGYVGQIMNRKMLEEEDY